MIREIVTDPILLSRPSREATAEDPVSYTHLICGSFLISSMLSPLAK